MIEAIPLSADCIVLIITKVEDPEELDTRFSNFAPSVHEDEGDSSIENMLQTFTEGAENVLDLFKRLREETEKIAGDGQALPDKKPEEGELCKVFSFTDLDQITRLAHVLSGFYTGRSSLYKDDRNGKYLLFLLKSNHTREDFNKVCNIASEYGTMENLTDVTIAYLDEHGGLIIKDDALQKLMFS